MNGKASKNVSNSPTWDMLGILNNLKTDDNCINVHAAKYYSIQCNEVTSRIWC